MAHEKWANRQIAAAIDLGVNPLDAAKAVNEFLVMLPQGADPDTYIVPARALEQELADERVLDDLRSWWYGGVEPRYARLLDATEET